VVVPTAATALFVASWQLWPIREAVHGHDMGVPDIVFWVALTMLASSSPVHVPRGSLVSVSAAPIIAAGILGGPTSAGIVAVLGTVEVRELLLEGRNHLTVDTAEILGVQRLADQLELVRVERLPAVALLSRAH